MEATIRFKDGTEIKAEQNGNSLIVSAKPTFPEDLSVVTIITEESTQEIDDAILVECASVDNRYWFAFIGKSESVKQAETIAALKSENNMLVECILEISEVVYGE